MASTIVQPPLGLLQNFHANAKKGTALYDAIAAAVVDIEAIQGDVTTLQAQDSTGTYTCIAGDAVGDVVYISAANTVALADANDAAKRPAIGIITAKASATSCTVQFFGEVTGLAGLTAGAAYYLSETAGDMTATPPAGNVQLLGYAKSTTILHLIPSAIAFLLSSTAASLGASLIGLQDSAGRYTATDSESAFAEVAGRIIGAAASEAAIKAIAAAVRVDGMICVDLTNDVAWIFDSGSGAGASAWVLVPDAGTGRWLRNHPSLADLSGVTATLGANLLGFEDSGNKTAQTTVDSALDEIYTHLINGGGVIELKPSDFYLKTGAPLAIFANGASAVPGSAFVDSKAFGIRWNDNAALDAIATSFQVPPDADITANFGLRIRASKTGATLADAVTFAVEAFNQVDAALHDADADFGGTSGAMTGDAAAKTIQSVSLTLALANLAAYPASVTMTIKPTDGTLGTDDLLFHGAYILYTKKLTS